MSTIVCRGLSFGYDGSEQSVFTNLDLVIDTGWRSALVGRNGRGKTTLLRLIHGELAPDRGSIERAVVTRRFPTMPSDPAVSAFEAAKDAAGPFRRWEAEMTGPVHRPGSLCSEAPRRNCSVRPPRPSPGALHSMHSTRGRHAHPALEFVVGSSADIARAL